MKADSNLALLYGPAAADLPRVTQLIGSVAKEPELEFLQQMLSAALSGSGKLLRPAISILSARLGTYNIELVAPLAASVELLHTATLVHDDVVDDSYKRRGFFSLNALWKNKIAVLVGDYLLSKGLLLSIENEDFDLLQIISVAVREMSQGELLQIEKARDLNITESVYYEIIRQKTAALLASCCAMGAQTVKASAEDVAKMHYFGELIGMAFQIKDDLFDYGSRNIGKPTGIDIKEQKMTLPLIYTLNKVGSKDKRWLINSIKNHNRDKRRVREVIDKVKQEGGLEFAIEKMQFYREEALAVLDGFPNNEFRVALTLMVNYVIERKI